ncbi:MAG: S41 family peptidase [Planctomycetota bacterium]|nr:MAG: S41 family peptidase [Planctomycetota bacterium]
MTRKLTRALGAVLLLLPGALAQEQAPPTPKTRLVVASEPAEASVFLRTVDADGSDRETFLGTTPAARPLELDLERSGPAEVVVFKQGYVCKIEPLRLLPGGTAHLEVRLAPDVEVPRGLRLKDTEPFVQGPEQFDELFVGVLFNVVRFYVEEQHPLRLIERATATLVEILDAVRAREKLLRRELSPEARLRYYGDEVDLRAYPRLSWAREREAEGIRRYTLRAGKLALTGTTDDSDLESYLRMLHRVYAFLKFRWDADHHLSDAILARCAIEGLLAALDDEHTHFLTPAEVRQMSSENEGSFGGVGIVVSGRGGALRVVAPMEGTPAQAAGILAGDRIVAIDGLPTARLGLREAVRLMRGPVGSRVVLTLRRGGRDLVVPLERADIRLKFTATRMLGADVGYLRITSFMNEHLSEKVAADIAALRKRGARALVIDLRNDPGGLLVQAHRIADLFVPSGRIVSTRTRLPEESRNLLADPKTPKVRMPLAVLINEGSASASEILAGTLQEHGLATVVGERSFGKGSVQRVFALEPFGCALALTVATYHLPSGRTPHKRGIAPDVEVRLTEEERLAVAERTNYTRDEGLAEDRQVRAALEVLRKRLAAAATSGE